MSDDSRSREHIWLIWVYFLLARIVGRINTIWGKNCPKLRCFGTFAGARAHHQGLRWLKPCQFQRNVYWHCEFDKLRPAAQFQLLAVCSSLTRGRWTNEPCLTRLQVANMEVSINDGSDWKTFTALLRPGQRLINKISNWLEVGVFRSKNIQISQHTMRSNSCSLAFWLRLLTKKELFKLLLDVFGTTFHLSWKQKSCFVMFSLRLND